MFSVSNFVKNNKKYLFSFGAAFAGSYALGAGASISMEHLDYSKESIAIASFVARTGSYFAINIPLHHYLHRKDYEENNRNASHEMRSIGTSNIIGTVSNLILQPSLHWTAMFLTIRNPYAFFSAYVLAGGISTLLKFTVDVKNKVILFNKPKDLEKILKS